ncbi:MAG: tetraacyldisaccharide 4'-kinase [Planctomycetota bacterium]
MNGRSRGLLGSSLRFGLWFASLGYGLVVRIRNRQFDSGRRESIECGVPVISVGNLTTGGTGKTPVVCLLANYFRQRRVRVALVSRGYARGVADHNDEAEELHQRLPDVPHLQDPDRVQAAQIAVEELESQLIVMDDGFQHRRLARHLDIVVVDATCPFGFGHLLPRGLLREPLTGLRRADAVIISRSDQVDAKRLDQIKSSVSKHNPELPFLLSVHKPVGLLDDRGQTEPIDSLAGTRVVAFCGIGNPDAFRRTIETAGATLLDIKALPDHAEYDRARVDSLTEWVRNSNGPSLVLCTHKDLVKVRRDRLGGLPLRAIVIDLEIEGLESLEPALAGILQKCRES